MAPTLLGEAIIQTFGGLGVDTSRVIKDKAAKTGLAFVSVQPDGERDFLFYFDPARDLALRPDEMDAAFLSSTRLFHYGSISLIAEPGRSATRASARLARAGGAHYALTTRTCAPGCGRRKKQ